MGATPISMSWGEVYNGIQSKALEGCEAQNTSTYPSRLYEVTKYQSKTAHFQLMQGLICGQSWFDSLPEDLQTLLVETAIEVGQETAADVMTEADEAEKAMVEGGMTVAVSYTHLVSGCLGAYVVLDSKGNGADSEPELVLGYGEVNPEGHIMTESARFFADKVSELTEGRVMVDIYPSGQLGDDARCYQAMEMGALDLYRGNSMSLVECGKPMVSALALPYIFRDREHFWNVCDSELGQQILDNIQDCTGMICLLYTSRCV